MSSLGPGSRPPIIAFAAMLALTLFSGVSASRQLAEPAEGASHPERKGARELPDSVLAVVSDRRWITASDLAGARAGASADSLTPQALRGFLELLIDREVLAERAGREAWAWTPSESAGYRALRDRLSVAAMLDSVLQSARRRLVAEGARPPDNATLGITIRDSLVARMDVTFDDPLVERLARAWAALPRPSSDSSAAAQVRMLAVTPRLDAADSAAVLARSRAGDYRVSQLLDSWRRLSPAYRPRVESGEQIRDLARNGLFERALREESARAGLERRPDIARALARAREDIAIAQLVEREVYAALEPDERQIERTYQEHRAAWRVPARVRVLSLAGSTRAEAEREALRLRDPAEAKRLAALAARQGLDLITELTASADSALFAEASRAGAGAVLGPTPRDGSWWVTRVESVLPERERSLAEVRPEIEHAVLVRTAERRLADLCRRWRKATRIEVNEREFARLAAALRDPVGSSP